MASEMHLHLLLLSNVKQACDVKQVYSDTSHTIYCKRPVIYSMKQLTPQNVTQFNNMCVSWYSIFFLLPKDQNQPLSTDQNPSNKTVWPKPDIPPLLSKNT